jgi:hypothetical protein
MAQAYVLFQLARVYLSVESRIKIGLEPFPPNVLALTRDTQEMWQLFLPSD